MQSAQPAEDHRQLGDLWNGVPVVGQEEDQSQAGNSRSQPGENDRAPGKSRFGLRVELADLPGLPRRDQAFAKPLLRLFPQPANFFAQTVLLLTQSLAHDLKHAISG